jgi:uncharacterized protein YqfA (UPF0365 family)
MTNDQIVVLLVLAVTLLAMLSFAAFMFILLRPWLRAFMAGAPVSILSIIGMRLRGNPPGLLIDTLLALKFRGKTVSIADVERVYLANKGQVHEPARLAGMVEERLRLQSEAAERA